VGKVRDVLRVAALLFLAGLWGCNDTVEPGFPPETPVPGTLADDPAWSPTSRDTIVYRRLAVGGAGWDYPCIYGIFLLDLQTGEEELLVPMGHYPRWSPDGRRLAYVIGESAAAEIYVMDLARRTEEQVTDNTDGSFLFDWSPEGTRLIFRSNSRLGICIMEIERPEPPWWNCLEGGLDARWTVTPAGEKIAYRTGAGNNWVIELMNADGSDQVQLTRRLSEAEELHSEPEWAPDGEKIIFRRQEHAGRFTEHSEIWSIRHDGSDERLLNADAPTWIYSEMTWSPDGSKIAYVAVAPDTADPTGRSHTVWVMEADGSSPRVLVHRDSVAAEVVWK